MNKKLLLLFLSLVMILSMGTSVFAQDNNQNNLSISNEEMLFLHQQFEKYKDNLPVATESEPYHEIDLGMGYVLYSSFQRNAGSDPLPASIVNPSSNNISAMDSPTPNEIMSSQGVKNAFGQDLMRMDFYTRWSFDYDKVTSGYSWIVPFNGLGYSLKATSVYGPNKSVDDREWDFTGVATFAIVVGGLDISTWSFTTLHLVRFNGTFAWRYV